MNENELTQDDFKRIYCTITISKVQPFEEDEYWQLKQQLENYLEPIASPWLLYPSFSAKDYTRCTLMFECNANALDIVHTYVHNSERFGPEYQITISSDLTERHA